MLGLLVLDHLVRRHRLERLELSNCPRQSMFSTTRNPHRQYAPKSTPHKPSARSKLSISALEQHHESLLRTWARMSMLRLQENGCTYTCPMVWKMLSRNTRSRYPLPPVPTNRGCVSKGEGRRHTASCCFSASCPCSTGTRSPSSASAGPRGRCRTPAACRCAPTTTSPQSRQRPSCTT